MNISEQFVRTNTERERKKRLRLKSIIKSNCIERNYNNIDMNISNLISRKRPSSNTLDSGLTAFFILCVYERKIAEKTTATMETPEMAKELAPLAGAFVPDAEAPVPDLVALPVGLPDPEAPLPDALAVGADEGRLLGVGRPV